RHGLDVDETGERLALGSTTGSLWVSEDGGDQFSEVSNDLPPIACVRFV
ncbi:MAG: exo-alpha-sialidase, partial [Ilumatobacteraceae bacterium]